ncbi:MAG: hypothetical protein U1F45_02105 [Burkholderiales bacterium]
MPGNLIHSNSGIGIDLFGVGANDGTTAGGQPNVGMDSLVIQFAAPAGPTLTVGATSSPRLPRPFANARVEFFRLTAWARAAPISAP